MLRIWHSKCTLLSRTREEEAVSISATIVLRDQFARNSPPVRAFFDALVELLTGNGRKQ